MNVHSGQARARVTLRPARLVFRQSLVAVGLGSTLIFAVLYWLTIPTGYWNVVLIIHVGLIICTAIAAGRFLGTRIVLTVYGVEERGFIGLTSRIRRTSVDSILIIDIYEQDSADTLRHLFVADSEGRLLLRMRGQYWAGHDMTRVAVHLGSPVTRVRRPVSIAEFRATSPRLLYWFERLSRFR